MRANILAQIKSQLNYGQESARIMNARISNPEKFDGNGIREMLCEFAFYIFLFYT